jgi:predicted RecA/RadA family phage recombinase
MGYVIGSMFGVAGADANVGELFALHLDGIYDLPKNTAEAWTVGQAINWDTGSAWATAGTGGTKIGVCSEQASSAATVGEVRLNGAF